MTFTFRAAGDRGWLAVASGSVLLAVEPGDGAFAESAWAAVRAADGFQRALDLLAGNGLASMPAFVLLEWAPGGTARVIVRGDSPVTVASPAGEQQLSGSGISTWLERSVESVGSVSFQVPGSEAVSGLDLLLESGVVLVASLGTAPTPAGQEPGQASARSARKGAAPSQPSPPAPAPAVTRAPAIPEPPAAPVPPPAAAADVDVEATVREPLEAPVPDAAPAEATPTPSTDSHGYHDLFGETMYRDVAEAAVREDVPDADTPVVDDALHDGETVMLDNTAKTRGRGRTADADVLHDGETVMLSGTGKGRERRGARGPAAEAPPARPGIVLVVAPTGVREPMTQPIVAGRSPSVSQVSGKQMPKLLTIGTADQDISRNHAQFALEGDTLVVTDLHSRNGTTIQLPNKPAQKLRGGEPTAVIVGTVIDFGGGVTVTVEEES